MNTKKFKIWLIENDHTVRSLATKLSLHEMTIRGYMRTERFPVVFCLALEALEV